MKLSTIKLCLLGSIFVSQIAFAEMQKITLDIQHMTCAMCPITVKKSLTNVNGVDGVKVSFENKTANVNYDDTLATVEELISATTNAGYPSSVHKDDPDGETK